MKHEELTQRVIGCIIQVHRVLGPGFVERIYRNALLLELHKAQLQVEAEKEIVVF